ncbi:lytic transglycosylase domain-containing protein [Nocardioides houyundeii]|uniref:aggregation-promoting factor C-terminal-like domain-containing protein n=1 Tax=Nocardioides houyundeii TaxID=2045452 RepID=UPI0013B42375|nr:lytic transglycosylase domain-containing protein [Nocardioides houyundeii]
MVATGAAVAGGMAATGTELTASDAPDSGGSQGAGQTMAGEVLADRGDAPVTRADRRQAKDPVKATVLSTAAGLGTTRTQQVSQGDPRDIARALLPQYGYGSGQFDCLNSLYVSESNWRIDADNPSSSAYGIPQALTQTHDLPEGYMTSAEVQIRWGLDYIKSRYGSPCSAWSFKAARGWY